LFLVQTLTLILKSIATGERSDAVLRTAMAMLLRMRVESENVLDPT
jgi:hypothetical protein